MIRTKLKNRHKRVLSAKIEQKTFKATLYTFGKFNPLKNDFRAEGDTYIFFHIFLGRKFALCGISGEYQFEVISSDMDKETALRILPDKICNGCKRSLELINGIHLTNDQKKALNEDDNSQYNNTN